jgi:hypothetical protein
MQNVNKLYLPSSNGCINRSDEQELGATLMGLQPKSSKDMG